MKIRQFQSGISLVEILVALVISLFLLGGIVQVYLGNKTTFKFSNAISEIQENGRFSLDTMSQDLRHVGDWGCILFNPSDTSNINDTLSAATVAGYDTDFHDFLNEEGIEGTNDTGLNGSDTLTIRGSKPGQVNIVDPFSPTSDQFLETDTINTITANDILLITRCGTNDLLIDAEADIFSVTSVVVGDTSTQRKINHGTTLSQTYQNDAAIKELQTVTYSIKNSLTTGEPSLFRSEFGNDQELIEGIENMQILYGIDTDNDDFPNQYVTSNNVPDYDDVVSIRIMLLARSIEDGVTEDFQVYTYNGVQTTATDTRLRQVFSVTIALRNRVG